MTIKEIITGIVIGLFIAILVTGGLFLWYTIDDISLCQNYEEANLNINFEWAFSTGCIFQLPDGAWINLREYKHQNEYKLEIEE